MSQDTNIKIMHSHFALEENSFNYWSVAVT